MDEFNADGSIEDPIEELAEILCTIFECEDMIRHLLRLRNATGKTTSRRLYRMRAEEWFEYLEAAHQDLQDLFPESDLSVHLDQTGNLSL